MTERPVFKVGDMVLDSKNQPVTVKRVDAATGWVETARNRKDIPGVFYTNSHFLDLIPLLESGVGTSIPDREVGNLQ